MRHPGLALALLFGVTPAFAGSVRVTSQHEKIELDGPKGATEAAVLAPEQVLSFSASGPATAAFRLCQLYSPGQAVVPLDITVIRDEQQQGTVRARVRQEPHWKAGGIRLCSAQLVLTIGVPAGKHSYQMIITGGREGVAIYPAEEMAAGESVVEATPEGDKGQVGPTCLPVKETTKKMPPSPRVLASETEVLEAPAPGRAELRVRTKVLRKPRSLAGDAGRVVTSLAGMFLVSTVACLASAGALEYRAHAEPVQLEAGRLHGQARRAWEASAVMGALAGVATVAALSLIWQGSLDGEAAWGIFRF